MTGDINLGYDDQRRSHFIKDTNCKSVCVRNKLRTETASRTKAVYARIRKVAWKPMSLEYGLVTPEFAG